MKKDSHGGNRVQYYCFQLHFKCTKLLNYFDISPQVLNLQDPVCSLALSRMYSSSRRNFICRMRCGKEENDLLPRGKGNRLKLLDDEYAIVHCTGYIKVLSWLRINNFTLLINDPH